MSHKNKNPVADRAFADMDGSGLNTTISSEIRPNCQAACTPNQTALAAFWRERRERTVHLLHRRKYGISSDLFDIFSGAA